MSFAGGDPFKTGPLSKDSFDSVTSPLEAVCSSALVPVGCGENITHRGGGRGGGGGGGGGGEGGGKCVL